MAMTLGTVMLIPMAISLKSTLQEWGEHGERNELIQHARLAMMKMTRELKYAEVLLQATSATHSYLEFTTTYLVDADAGTENVLYYRLNGNEVLYRQVDGGSAYMVAGIPNTMTNTVTFAKVDSLEIIPLKDDGSGNLIVLGASPLSAAIAVQLNLVMSDEDGQAVAVSSLVKMRNV